MLACCWAATRRFLWTNISKVNWIITLGGAKKPRMWLSLLMSIDVEIYRHNVRATLCGGVAVRSSIVSNASQSAMSSDMHWIVDPGWRPMLTLLVRIRMRPWMSMRATVTAATGRCCNQGRHNNICDGISLSVLCLLVVSVLSMSIVQ